MKQTIKQIKDLATATDNVYLYDIINKLETEIEDKLKKLEIMKTKRHQLERLQRLALRVKGLIKLAEFEEKFQEASRLRETQFQLRQLVFKFKL